MSNRQTPKRQRHRNHGSSSVPRQVGASDYESDAAQYLESREPIDPPAPRSPPRDNTELSLRVLRRYQPTIRTILAIAANAVAYSFLEASQSWEKHGAEGTMFVCDQDPVPTPTGQVLPRQCVFVLNRRSMDNLVIDLLRVTDCEVVGELIVFRFEDDTSQGEDGGREKKIIGLWIHADETNIREVYTSLILGAWQQARLAVDAYIQAMAGNPVSSSVEPTNPQPAASFTTTPLAGKRISVSDLFRQKNGG